MNIPFDIVKGKGPVIYDPLRTAAAVNEVREFVPEEWVPYVGQALNLLRDEVSIHFQHPNIKIGNMYPAGHSKRVEIGSCVHILLWPAHNFCFVPSIPF
jgi:hypothetical protein